MFPDLNKVEVKETTSYLTAGIHEVKIDEMRNSNQKEGYTGTPYVEFKVSNKDGISYLKFSGVDANTSENAARVRTEIFKGFLQTAGATSFNSLPTACKEALGNKINVCLREREYWTTDKDTGAPVVKTVVEYKFANPVGKSISWQDKYNQKLSPADQAAYKAANDAFLMSQGNVQTDDMPF
ncbi:MAG: hypothetical protein CMC75_03225 [Flavobacteriaceae bacterium]|nr:hypothetical protein [Flavobacteriaceae bacterium]